MHCPRTAYALPLVLRLLLNERSKHPRRMPKLHELRLHSDAAEDDVRCRRRAGNDEVFGLVPAWQEHAALQLKQAWWWRGVGASVERRSYAITITITITIIIESMSAWMESTCGPPCTLCNVPNTCMQLQLVSSTLNHQTNAMLNVRSTNCTAHTNTGTMHT